MTTAGTISGLVPHAVIREAALMGMDPLPLLEVAGIDADSDRAADSHIDIDRYHQLWERIMTEVHDPGFPIRAGSAFRIEDNEVFGFLAMSCETLGQAFARTARYRNIYSTGARWEVQEDGSRVRLIWYPWPADRRRVGVRARPARLLSSSDFRAQPRFSGRSNAGRVAPQGCFNVHHRDLRAT